MTSPSTATADALARPSSDRRDPGVPVVTTSYVLTAAAPTATRVRATAMRRPSTDTVTAPTEPTRGTTGPVSAASHRVVVDELVTPVPVVVPREYRGAVHAVSPLDPAPGQLRGAERPCTARDGVTGFTAAVAVTLVVLAACIGLAMQQPPRADMVSATSDQRVDAESATPQAQARRSSGEVRP
jgi:hypothetical protein